MAVVVITANNQQSSEHEQTNIKALPVMSQIMICWSFDPDHLTMFFFNWSSLYKQPVQNNQMFTFSKHMGPQSDN